jgi:glutathione peroxidase-family protein
MSDIYSIETVDIDGTKRSMSEFRNKVLLIVNVASKSEWTPQYKNLQTMYTRNRDRGFEVLAFPCDSFGRQETGTDAEIKSFCSSTYGVTFPLFSKVSVKGKEIHPLFAWLTEKGTNPESPGKITQNFNKFLVSRKGQIVARFESKDDALGDKIPRLVGQALDR